MASERLGPVVQAGSEWNKTEVGEIKTTSSGKNERCG